MERKREQWQNCDPNVIAPVDAAAIYHAINDARTDILHLYAERDALAAQVKAFSANAKAAIEKYDASRLHFHTHFGPSSPLHRFLDAAGGEGYVLGGVDAGDLFVALYGYPEDVDAARAGKEA